MKDSARFPEKEPAIRVEPEKLDKSRQKLRKIFLAQL
jgi:hypothetical protein